MNPLFPSPLQIELWTLLLDSMAVRKVNHVASDVDEAEREAMRIESERRKVLRLARQAKAKREYKLRRKNASL